MSHKVENFLYFKFLKWEVYRLKVPNFSWCKSCFVTLWIITYWQTVKWQNEKNHYLHYAELTMEFVTMTELNCKTTNAQKKALIKDCWVVFMCLGLSMYWFLIDLWYETRYCLRLLIVDIVVLWYWISSCSNTCPSLFVHSFHIAKEFLKSKISLC